MFITKSEKQSLVETSLNLGEKVLKLESELNYLKSVMKKSPSWKWVETLDEKLISVEKIAVSATKKENKRIESLEERVRLLLVELNAMQCSIQELNLKRPVVIQNVEKKSTQKPVIAKKRGRPVGSKANRPKFPPKTPFELKKPLGRPKGSKNKAK